MAGLSERLGRLFAPAEIIDPSPPVSDRVVATTCYMCACRCGIHVHLKDGRLRYIAGNPDHPVNRGVLCGKGAAGIMQQNSPAKLSKPLLRVGERGEGRFREIEWDDAMALAAGWLGAIRASDPRRLAFFTGRDQSQALTGLWAAAFGTPNYAAHGGFCSVNMAAAGLYTVGGSFWEFGEPDWALTRLMLLFGVAEDHDSNPIKIGLAGLKRRGVKIISVNPVRTGYSAIADEWVGIRPGTDGLLILALIHELLKAGRFDADYLARYSNAPWLVVRDPGGPGDGLFARDGEGRVLVWDEAAGAARPASQGGALFGEVVLPDGRRAVPSFHLLAARYLDCAYGPDAVAERCGIPADTIRRLAEEIGRTAFEAPVVLDQPWTDMAGTRHATMTGRPVAMHAMRGISAHANGFHTARALHLLQLLIGSVDVPGGWRFKAPYPKPCPPTGKPAGKPGEVRPGQPLPGMPLGNPLGPEDLLVDAAGEPLRLDRAFSWEAPLALHGLMHSVIANAWAGEPYRIDTLFLYMANMAWNSAMNTAETMRMLADRDEAGDYRIPHIIYADAYQSEMVAYADLVLPDTTYLERWDCISLLDRPIGHASGPGDAIRQPVLPPDRDVRPFQDVLIALGARLGLPAFAHEDGRPRYPGLYPDYIVNHQRRPGIGPLAGWRGPDGASAGRGPPNPDQLARYVENGCFWQAELEPDQRYFKHANRSYLEAAVRLGLIEQAEPVTFQLYSEVLQRFRLAAQGHGAVPVPVRHRARIAAACDPLPIWFPALEPAADDAFPLHAVSQRPMAMYHSWHSQNAWLRQLYTRNFLHMNRQAGEALGLADGDWVWITSPNGRVRGRVRLMEGCHPSTVWTWNAIAKRAGAWGLDPAAPEAMQGILLNHLIRDRLEAPGGPAVANADPVTGQAAWYDLRVRVEKAAAPDGLAVPRFAPLAGSAEAPRPAILRTGAAIRAAREAGRP